MVKRALLLILDGFGLRPDAADNAIAVAGMPRLNFWRRRCACAQLETSGSAVGLPDGQMGNSEVGHINIGAGRVVKQTLVRINEAVRSGALAQHPTLMAMAERLPVGRRLHLLALVSDGGIHSAMEHLIGAVEAAVNLGVSEIAFHVITDGRDSAPDSAPGFVATMQAALPSQAYIASVSGRFYAMDRDQRWDRVEAAWRVIVEAQGEPAASAQKAIEAAYGRGETDEFIAPTVVRAAPIEDGDALWFLNFRADRVRELAAALTKADEPGCFQRRLPLLSSCIGMVRYRQDLAIEILFEPIIPQQTLGELLGRSGQRQLRLAETEKYAHITYFLNGGTEAIFDGEERSLVDSPRDIATYDLRPEMSAIEVTERLVAALEAAEHGLIVCNYANPDMVGHTGKLEAAVQALRVLDDCLDKVFAAAEAGGYGLLLCADHGNIERMRTEDGEPHTQHTTNPVPLMLFNMGAASAHNGALCDIAPTLLDHMGIEQPAAMDGRSLLVRP